MSSHSPNLPWFVLSLFAAAQVWGAALPDGATALREEKKLARHAAETSLKLDPGRIINESNGFLKEREPEMSAEEYALYERVTSMLATEPALAVNVLEAMMTGTQAPSPAFEFILANAYYANKQTDKAETLYRSAVKRYPAFTRAWNNLGVLYYYTGNFAAAVPCFAKSISLGDQEADTVGLLGYCLEQTGDPVSAQISYEQALARSPGSPDWLEGLLRVCLQSKQYGRAESLVQKLILLHPDEPQFWLTRANILLLTGRKLDAMAALEAAVGAGFGGPGELELLADLYAEQELNPEAAAIYEKLLAVSPVLGERKLLYFAQVLVDTGRLKPAEEALARLKVADLTPAGRIDLALIRADILAARLQWSEARKKLREVLQVAPLNGRALLALGRAYLAEENSIEASFAFGSALAVPDFAYRARLELANIELKNRHYAQCAEHLRLALSLERTDAIEDLLTRVRAQMVDK